MELTIDAAIAAALMLATALVMLHSAASVATQAAEDFEHFDAAVNAVLASELLISDPALLAAYDDAANSARPQTIEPKKHPGMACYELGGESRCSGLAVKRLVFVNDGIEVLKVYA